MKQSGTPRQIWLVPAMLALSSAFGLLAALFGDNIWDLSSWIALSVPLVTAAYFARSKTPRRRQPRGGGKP